MDEMTKIKVNPLIIGAVIVQLVFVIVSVVMIQGLLEPKQPEPSVNVSGFNQEFPDAPGYVKELIEFYTYQAISNNNPGSIVLKNGLSVRNDSVIKKYYEDVNVNFISLIVDIPEIEQSYRATQIWSDDEKNQYISPNVNTAVVCLDADEMIYPKFNCKNDSMYSAMTVMALILRMVNYKLDGDEGLSMKFEQQDGSNNAKIRINYSDCDSMCFCKKVPEDKQRFAISKFGTFLNGLGYSLEQVPHYFYNCDNEQFFINENGELIY